MVSAEDPVASPPPPHILLLEPDGAAQEIFTIDDLFELVLIELLEGLLTVEEATVVAADAVEVDDEDATATVVAFASQVPGNEPFV